MVWCVFPPLSAAACLCAVSFMGCDGKEQPPPPVRIVPSGTSATAATPRSKELAKRKKEWFWRDRLDRRPEPFPPGPGAGTDAASRAAESLLEGLRGKGLADAEAAVDRLTALGPGAVPALAARAGDPHREVRWAAVAALCRIGDPRGQEALLRALRDPWDAPAVLAAATLPRIGEPWIIPRLIKALGPYPVDYNPHLMVRVMAAAGLVRMGVFSGVPFLIKVLKDNTPAADPEREWDPDPRLAWEKEEALHVLASLAGGDFGFRVDAPLAVQAEAAARFETWWRTHRRTLWKQAPPLEDPLLRARVRELVEGLASFQARNADGARYCLFMLGPPVFPYLAEAATSGGFYQRFHALGIAARLAPLAGEAAPRWTEALLPALRDPAPAVRTKAAEALGRLGVPAVLPGLKEALHDPDGDVRLAAVDALGRIGGKEARTLVEDLLRTNRDPQLRVEGEAALARMDPKRISSLLAELLSPDASVQEWAAQKLLDLYGEDFDFPVGESPEARSRAVERIRRALAGRRGG